MNKKSQKLQTRDFIPSVSSRLFIRLSHLSSVELRR